MSPHVGGDAGRPCEDAGRGAGTLYTYDWGGHVLVEPDRPVPADQIASQLTELGRRGASGAFEITGQPGGNVYLRNGYLVWAESSAVPDLGTRLIRSRRLPPPVWDQIARDDGPDGTIGATLVARDFLTRAELERLLQSIVLDTLLALTKPFAGECRVTGFSFVPQRSHWAETVLAMDVAMVRRYLDHMAQQLAWYDVSPRECPRWPAGWRPETVVNSGQRAVACLIDGRTTVSELAWRGGLSLHETMASVGQLAHKGVCRLPVPDAVPAPPVPAGDGALAGDGAPAGRPGSAGPCVAAAQPAPAQRCADPERPERLTRPALPRRGPLTGTGATPQVRATPLELGLLQRVRQGLERMA